MSSDESVEIENVEEACKTRHKKEKKKLQGEITRLKSSISKGDKKRKKEVATQIEQMEKELEQRHKEELEAARQEQESIRLSENLDVLKLADCTEPLSGGDRAEHEKSTESAVRISKAQKRKAKKVQKEAEANERIRLGEAESLNSDRTIEEAKFQRILSDRGLKMHQVPSDGDCLYASFVHQLGLQGIKSSVKELRRSTSHYMRQHREVFQPFLFNETTGDLYTEDEYDEYCDRVENTPEWGGNAELRALSEVLRADVEVVQAEAPSIRIGSRPEGSPKIIVTYHRHAYSLGEHYNSVAPVPYGAIRDGPE